MDDLATVRAAVERLQTVTGVVWLGPNRIDAVTVGLAATREQSADVHMLLRLVPSLLALLDAQAARLAAVEQALRWAVETLDGYRAELIADGLPGGTEHWMPGWADWLEQQARPALKGAPDGAR
jgi:hypothetical protein